MKLISWNVNGLRAAMGKGFLEFTKEADPDILCIQAIPGRPCSRRKSLSVSDAGSVLRSTITRGA